MKTVIAWIKANPISLTSIVIVLMAVGVLVLVPLKMGASLTEEVAKRDADYKSVDRFMRQIVEMPPEHPDEPPHRYSNITINPAVIERRKSVNQQINQQYEGTYAYAVSRNVGPDREQKPGPKGKPTRRFLMPGLFPISQDIDVRFLARKEYIEAFPDMLKDWSQDATGPRLDAGMPPSPDRIASVMAEVEQEFANSQQVTGRGAAAADDQQELMEQKTIRLMELLRERAETIHIYAETDPQSPEFPLQIGAWGYGEEFPEPQQIWEGQLELWVQQDIARAIAMANNVDASHTRLVDRDGQPVEEVYPANVMDAPVKRLLRIEVIPGYVGFHTRGGVVSRDSQSQSLQRADGSYPPPSTGMTGSLDQRQPDNFDVSPSGRVSNAVYDVRHARVEAVVDFQQLPALFNAISEVSFMTVLDCQIEDVDEYEALAEGYFYGMGDAVRVTMVIETIWLREWTEGLMPDKTKQYLGLAEPVDIGETSNRMDYGGGPPTDGYYPPGP